MCLLLSAKAWVVEYEELVEGKDSRTFGIKEIAKALQISIATVDWPEEK